MFYPGTMFSSFSQDILDTQLTSKTSADSKASAGEEVFTIVRLSFQVQGFGTAVEGADLCGGFGPHTHILPHRVKAKPEILEMFIREMILPRRLAHWQIREKLDDRMQKEEASPEFVAVAALFFAGLPIPDTIATNAPLPPPIRPFDTTYGNSDRAQVLTASSFEEAWFVLFLEDVMMSNDFSEAFRLEEELFGMEVIIADVGSYEKVLAAEKQRVAKNTTKSKKKSEKKAKKAVTVVEALVEEKVVLVEEVAPMKALVPEAVALDEIAVVEGEVLLVEHTVANALWAGYSDPNTRSIEAYLYRNYPRMGSVQFGMWEDGVMELIERHYEAVFWCEMSTTEVQLRDVDWCAPLCLPPRGGRGTSQSVGR